MSISLFLLVDFRKAFDTIPLDNLWERLQRLRVPSHLQYVVKAMYNVIYPKFQINGDTHGEVMSYIGVKQGCPLSPILFGLYIDELETYLDKIDGDSSCLIKIVVAILLYADEVVLLSRSNVGLQRLLNKLFEFCISSSLQINLAKTKK